MISVEEALTRVLALATPLPTEVIPLAEGAGRILAVPAVAGRDQPPFAASAMDGYAINGAQVQPGARFRVVGEAPAGQALRIFTGAPLPQGTDRVVIQEDVTRDGDLITLSDSLDTATHVRPAGADFAAGFTLDTPRRLRAVDLALLAAMNVADLTVTRRPEVALIATGDELVMPGEAPRPDQIVASNIFGLKAMIEAEGAVARLLPIARDTEADLSTVFDLAEGADLIVTIGGASVGDHDLVGRVAAGRGLERSFYKIAMRPGKPLMAGRLGTAAMLGLPGNPVSALVCGHLFLLPLIRAMSGLPAAPAPMHFARLAVDVGPSGPRDHYMRARLVPDPDGGAPLITPFDRQDSALLSVLAQADALLLRRRGDEPRPAGHSVRYLPL